MPPEILKDFVPNADNRLIRLLDLALRAEDTLERHAAPVDPRSGPSDRVNQYRSVILAQRWMETVTLFRSDLGRLIGDQDLAAPAKVAAEQFELAFPDLMGAVGLLHFLVAEDGKVIAYDGRRIIEIPMDEDAANALMTISRSFVNAVVGDQGARKWRHRREKNQ